MTRCHQSLVLFFLCVALSASLPGIAKADTVENLTFTGFATCTDANCATYGNGAVTGYYTLDVTTQTIGSYSFTTPFAVFASTDAGAQSLLANRFNDYNPEFLSAPAGSISFLQFFFPSNTELGPLATNVGSDACIPVAPGACDPDYKVTGSTALTTAPEPTSLVLLGSGVLSMLGIVRRRLN